MSDPSKLALYSTPLNGLVAGTKGVLAWFSGSGEKFEKPGKTFDRDSGKQLQLKGGKNNVLRRKQIRMSVSR
jgi:hypothetical protein